MVKVSGKRENLESTSYSIYGPVRGEGKEPVLRLETSILKKYGLGAELNSGSCEYLERQLKVAKAGGIEKRGVHLREDGSDFNFNLSSPENCEGGVKRFEELLERYGDIKTFICHSEEWKKLDEKGKEAYVNSLEKVGRAASKNDQTVFVEYVIGVGEREYVDTLRRIKSKNVSACIDVGHFFLDFTGRGYSDAEAVEKTAKSVGEIARLGRKMHFHVHDTNYRNSDHEPIGGRIGEKGIEKILKSATGYLDSEKVSVNLELGIRDYRKEKLAGCEREEFEEYARRHNLNFAELLERAENVKGTYFTIGENSKVIERILSGG